jgi:hypothetical protein
MLRTLVLALSCLVATACDPAPDDASDPGPTNAGGKADDLDAACADNPSLPARALQRTVERVDGDREVPTAEVVFFGVPTCDGDEAAMRDALVAAVHAIAYEDFSASDPFVVAVPDDGLAAFEARLAGLHRALDERVADGLFSPADPDAFADELDGAVEALAASMQGAGYGAPTVIVDLDLAECSETAIAVSDPATGQAVLLHAFARC